MNLLDIIITITMIFLLVRGIIRGFFREIASLAGVILGIIFANQFQPEMTSYLEAYLPAGKFLPLISFGLLFAVVFVLCGISGWLLNMAFKKVFLGWADRTLGAGLAILKGIIITYLVIVLLTFFVPSKTPLIAGSRLAPLIVASYQSVVGLISPDFFNKLKSEILEDKKKIDKVVSEKMRDFGHKDESR